MPTDRPTRQDILTQLRQAGIPDTLLAAVADNLRPDPCPDCQGQGERMYSTSEGYMNIPGLIHAQAFTQDTCDTCWGTGITTRTGVDLRQLRTALYWTQASLTHALTGLADAANDGLLSQSLAQSIAGDTHSVSAYTSRPTPYHIPADLSRTGVVLDNDTWAQIQATTSQLDASRNQRLSILANQPVSSRLIERVIRHGRRDELVALCSNPTWPAADRRNWEGFCSSHIYIGSAFLEASAPNWMSPHTLPRLYKYFERNAKNPNPPPLSVARAIMAASADCQLDTLSRLLGHCQSWAIVTAASDVWPTLDANLAPLIKNLFMAQKVYFDKTRDKSAVIDLVLQTATIAEIMGHSCLYMLARAAVPIAAAHPAEFAPSTRLLLLHVAYQSSPNLDVDEISTLSRTLLEGQPAAALAYALSVLKGPWYDSALATAAASPPRRL